MERDNIQSQEDKMPHDMSLKMESKKIYKNSRETSPKRKIKKFWRPKIGGFNSHVKTGDSYEEESLEEDTHSRNDDHTIIEKNTSNEEEYTHSINSDHTIVEENPNNEEDLEMTLLLC